MILLTSFTHFFFQYDVGNADASFLDEWSFDQFQSLLNRTNEDSKLKELLLQDSLVIFLHLLGCDSNGHAHRPFSSTYLNNVKVVDHIAERVYHLVEDYYKDNRTAYIFTADHGMSDKGWELLLIQFLFLKILLLQFNHLMVITLIQASYAF